jgi:uncharacterized protein
MSQDKPWYRHRWPWLLMLGPGAVVVAGAITIWIAFASADGLVADDYYKQGLAVNRQLAKEEAARGLGVTAEVRIGGGTIAVRLAGQRPEALFVQLAHATRAGHDVRLRLVPDGAGTYQAELPALPPGRWRVVIEDARGAWRITRDAS